MGRSIMPDFVSGVHKSLFDGRDFLVRGYFEPTILPREYDITHQMTRVRSQGQEGACVGFALSVGVKEYQEQQEYCKFIQLSPRYIYEEAKKISGHTSGTTLKAAMQVVKNKGVCEEKYWPYSVPQIAIKDALVDTNASKYKVLSYARVVNIDELKNALLQFGPVLIGISVYAGMRKANDTGVVPNPGCLERRNVLGGHALCAVAYNDDSPYYNDGHIKCKNSWGPEFGNKGYIYLSYHYIRSNMMDAFSCIDIVNDDPLTVANLIHSEKGVWV